MMSLVRTLVKMEALYRSSGSEETSLVTPKAGGLNKAKQAEIRTLLFSLYTFDIHLAKADFETTNASQQKDEVEGLLQNFSTTSQKSALDKDELLARLRTTRSALKAVYEALDVAGSEMSLF